jgi:hypothetical protein
LGRRIFPAHLRDVPQPWYVNCGTVNMMITNSTYRVSIGLGVAGAAALTFYVVNRQRRNRTLLGRARRHANMLSGRVTQLISDSAFTWLAKTREEAARQRKGVVQALEAGKTAYQKVAG